MAASVGPSPVPQEGGAGDRARPPAADAVAPRLGTGRPAPPTGAVRQPRSGGGKAEHAGLADHARAKGAEVVVLGAGSDLQSLAEDAVAGGADALGVAGGDGSLAVVATVAMDHGLPFVCIPAGTRNHFALDVGVDRRDLVGALDAFTDGVERRIDIAAVNGRLFLDNVSLGIYGDAVQRRGVSRCEGPHAAADRARGARPGRGGGRAAPGGRPGRRAPHPAVVIVSNNPYAVHQPVVTGTRPSLTTGRLGVLVVGRPDASGPGPGPVPNVDGDLPPGRRPGRFTPGSTARPSSCTLRCRS